MGARKTGAGAANQGGVRYQDLVAAWFAVLILAEQDTEAPLELGSDVLLTWLGCETGEPVDDVGVRTSRGGRLYCQAKHTVSAGETPNSEFASILDQFVRQYLLGCDDGPQRRPLDPERDRLVIVTGPASPTTIREVLNVYLRHVRDLLPGQVIDPAALTVQQREIHKKVVIHVAAAWRSARGRGPSDLELAGLLRLVWVQVLDVDPNGDQEREAKGLLRTSVLGNPTQAHAAWSHLTKKCLDYGSERAQADRARLQGELLSAGFALRPVRSYRGDIERLVRYSGRTTEAIVAASVIRFAEQIIRVDRAAIAVLRAAVDGVSILVVGEPGAGKSAVGGALAKALGESGRDVIHLDLARFDLASAAALRVELGLEHDLSDVLANWPGTEPGIFILDTLDAARTEGALRLVRGLVADVLRVGGRWHVAALVRKYDLRQDHELRGLFPGDLTPRHADPDLSGVRHTQIPAFGEDELGQVASQSPALAAFLAAAPAPLSALLRNPFNLRLVCEILGSGIAAAALAPIRSQAELLDRYWECRVLGDGQGDAREAVLRRAVEAMVRDRRRQVRRGVVVTDPAAAAPLHHLLSSHVLVEWRPRADLPPDRQVLSFAHDILFDYAVATLVLRGDPESIRTRIGAEPDLVLVLRPSLVLLFQSEWHRDPSRAGYWNLVIRLSRADEIPEVGKLIGPGVAAELMTDARDCGPLFVALDGNDAADREGAERALHHLVGWLLAAPAPIGTWPQSGPWCGVAERVSRSLRSATVPPVANLLRLIGERVALLAADQFAGAGLAARRLLEFSWAQSPRHGPLVKLALEQVCITHASAPSESSRLLRRSLQPRHLSEHGHEELFVLARHVAGLAAVDPELVIDVYAAAFSYSERSDAPTDIASGPLFPLRWNRRQAYDWSLYQLGELYARFLAGHPIPATRALIAALDGHLTNGTTTRQNPVVDTFVFAGRPARLLTDYSSIWDTDQGHHHEPIVKMLDNFEAYLTEPAGDGAREGNRRAIIDVIVAENRAGAIWRRLLRCGGAAPRTLGQDLLPLAFAAPILTRIDTADVAATYLAAVYDTLAVDERRNLEGVIFSLPEGLTGRDREAMELDRDRLLGVLAGTTLITPEAARRLTELKASGGPPPNVPPYTMGEVTWSEPTEEDQLRESGIDLAVPANRNLHALVRPVREFAEAHVNSTPTRTEVEAIGAALLTLRAALEGDARAGVHMLLAEAAWDHLAAAAARSTKSRELAMIGGLGESIRAILIEASVHHCPEPSPEGDASFDRSPSWASAQARIEAAIGLMRVAHDPTFMGEDLPGIIRRLATDPVPAVRFHIAAGLLALYRQPTDLFWELLDHFTRAEPSVGVLQGAVQVMGRLPDEHAALVAHLARTIFDRVPCDTGPLEVRGVCVQILANLDVRLAQADAREAVERIIDDPAGHEPEVRSLLFWLRPMLTHGAVARPAPGDDAIRRRSFDILSRILDRLRDELERIKREHALITFESWPEVARQRLRRVSEVVHNVSWELYFASGAFEGGVTQMAGGRSPLEPERRRRFLAEAAPCFDILVYFPGPQIAHHVIETLESLVDFDPRGVLHRINRVVTAAQTSGYQHDPMATSRVTGLVERYLSGHRDLLRDDVECRSALREILDVFGRAGSAETLRLIAQLDQLFR